MPDGTEAKLSVKDFARRVRDRYPGAYDYVPDRELTERVIRKYPVYAEQVDLAPPTISQPFSSRSLTATPVEDRRLNTTPSPAPAQPAPFPQPIARVPINGPVSTPPNSTFIGQPRPPQAAELQYTSPYNPEQQSFSSPTVGALHEHAHTSAGNMPPQQLPTRIPRIRRSQIQPRQQEKGIFANVGKATFAPKAFKQANDYLVSLGQQPLTKEQYLANQAKGASVEIGYNPSDFKIDGTAVTSPELEQGESVEGGTLTTPRVLGKPNENMSGIAKRFAPTDAASTQDAARQAILAAAKSLNLSVDNKKLEAFLKRTGGLQSDYQKGDQISVLWGTLAEVVGSENVRNAMRMEQAQSRPQAPALPPTDLFATKEAKELGINKGTGTWIRELIDKPAETGLGDKVDAFVNTINAPGKFIGRNAIVGLLRGGADTSDAVAGGFQYLGDMSDQMDDWDEQAGVENGHHKAGDFWRKLAGVFAIDPEKEADVAKIGDKGYLAGGVQMLAQLPIMAARMEVLPGGPVAKFATDAALQARGRNLSKSEIIQSAVENGMYAGIASKFAPFLGKAANTGTATLLNRAPMPLLEKGVELAAVPTMVYGTSRAFGHNSESSFENAVLFTGFHLATMLGQQKMKGLVTEVRDPEGRAAKIKVEDGKIKLADPDAKADIQVATPMAKQGIRQESFEPTKPNETQQPTAQQVPGENVSAASPYSQGSLKEAFNLTDEQAAATDVLVKAMGLDTSKIDVAKGGLSGKGALKQEPFRVPDEDIQRFGAYVDRFVDGSLDRAPKAGKVLERTPAIYRKLGAKDYPFALPYQRIRKVLRDKHSDSMSPEILKKVPEALADPVLVADYLNRDTGEKGLNVLSDIKDLNGNPVLIGLRPNEKMGRYDVHLVTTVFGKERPELMFDQWVRDKSIRYVNKEKLQEISTTYGNPASVVQEYLRANPRILTNADFVKDDFLSQDAKGATEFVEDGKAIIRGLQNPDVSTAAHEIAHVARRQLFNRGVRAENRAGVTDADIDVVERWSGVKSGYWQRANEERFARGFERYLRDGKAPTPKLADVFAKFKDWLTNIYIKLRGSDIDIRISPEVKQVFDRWLGAKSEADEDLSDDVKREQEYIKKAEAQRVEESAPASVRRASIDTRVRGVTDFLKQQDGFVTTDEIARVTRINKSNVDDAVSTLYNAGMVETLPGNRVRLINQKEAAGQVVGRAERTPEGARPDIPQRIENQIEPDYGFRGKILEDEDREQGWEFRDGKWRTIEEDSPETPEGSLEYGASNKIVTRERAQKAREILAQKSREKGTKLYSGFPPLDIDPEEAKARLELAAYHIEAKTRKFADFAKVMIEELGGDIAPHLVKLYNDVKEKYKFQGMETAHPGDESRNKLVKWKGRGDDRLVNRAGGTSKTAMDDTQTAAEAGESKGSSSAQTPDDEEASLEGEKEYVIKDSSGVHRAEIDFIEGKNLWEEKSIVNAIDRLTGRDRTSRWINKFITKRVAKVYQERKRLPKYYHDAAISFDFTSPDVDPSFRSAVNAEIKRLRSIYSDVHIKVRWR